MVFGIRYSVNGNGIALHNFTVLLENLSRCYSRGVCFNLIACFICVKQIALSDGQASTRPGLNLNCQAYSPLSLTLHTFISISLSPILFRFWGLLMKCHAVQVQLVLYADLQKATPIMLRLIFIIIFVLLFLPIACSCCCRCCCSCCCCCCCCCNVCTVF